MSDDERDRSIAAELFELADELDSIGSDFYADRDCGCGEPLGPDVVARLNALRHAIQTAKVYGYIDMLREIVDAFNASFDVAQQRYSAREQRRQSEWDERRRKHELTLKVACPHCSAEIGRPCRTPAGYIADDHSMRYRSARSLHEERGHSA